MIFTINKTSSTFLHHILVGQHYNFALVLQGMFESLPYILEWTRTSLFMDISKKSSRYVENSTVRTEERLAATTISSLSYVLSACLRLLRLSIVKSKLLLFEYRIRITRL